MHHRTLLKVGWEVWFLPKQYLRFLLRLLLKRKPIVEILDYLNHKTHSHYKPTSKKTKKAIRARMNEGFTLDDFKKVIDLKTSELLYDPYWSKFLRQETLFRTKFESFLNQKGLRRKITEEDLNLYD